MSSKNRTKASKAHDRYLTPPRLARAAFEQLVELRGEHLFNTRFFLEPGAGPGPFARLASMYCSNLERVMGVELFHKDRGSDYELVRKDFLKWDTLLRFDLIISNPPFTYAEEFIRKAYDLLYPGGVSLFLMRIGVAGSKKRRALWHDIPLNELWMCRPRPSFIAEGGSDSAEYAFFLMTKTAERASGPTLFRFLDWDPDF